MDVNVLDVVEAAWEPQVTTVGRDVVKKLIRRVESLNTQEEIDQLIQELTADVEGQPFDHKKALRSLVFAIELTAACIAIGDKVAELRAPDPPAVVQELKKDENVRSIIKKFDKEDAPEVEATLQAFAKHAK